MFDFYVCFEEIPNQNRFIFVKLFVKEINPDMILYRTSFGPVLEDRSGLRKHKTSENKVKPNLWCCVPENWSLWYQTKNDKFLRPDKYLPSMTEENDLVLYLRDNFYNKNMDYFDTMLFSCHLDYIKHQTKSQVVLDYIAGHENNCSLLQLFKKVHTPLTKSRSNLNNKAVLASEGLKYYQHEKFEMAKRALNVR